MSRRRAGLFARLSLDYADHPKIAGLSDAAFRVHVEMILYSRRYLTDGHIAKQIAKRWPSNALAELATNDVDNPSLRQEEDGSYTLHGFDEMQETREEVQVKRDKRAEAGRKGGLARASKLPSKVSSKNVAETEIETEVHTSHEARPDVEEILDHLDAAIHRHDPEARLPGRTKGNHDAGRRLIDLDRRTADQVKAVIDWSQQSDFWRPNVRSMTKLREKYDVLRGQAQRDGFLRPAASVRPEPVSMARLPKCPTCNAPQEITHYEGCPDEAWRPTA